MNIFEDDDKVKYKYLDRSCKVCKKYPCIEGMDKLPTDFAKYGCTLFEDYRIISGNRKRKVSSKRN